MNVLYYDCFSGISGDMNIGALVNLGVPVEYLLDELKKLNLDGFSLECKPAVKMGISGTYAHVHLDEKHHHHDHHEHDHSHGRNLKEITRIITTSSLSEFTKNKSLQMFKLIGEAEAKIHSKNIDEIHFHEVGALDSIVDIVCAALCIDFLKPDRIIASPVELGGGFVTCAHGVFPVPAPATAEILKDVPVKTGAVDRETTTPTGAAILKTFVDEFSSHFAFSILKTAYGIGYHDFQIPNVLRVCLAEMNENTGLHTDRTDAILIECNIDDMNPEQYEFIMEKLFEAGAQDVFIIPVIMKKSRPGIEIKVLCSREDQPAMEEIILKETTSLGLRYTNVTKSMLQRQVRTLDTMYGPVRVKEALLEGKIIKYKAEYDDCSKAARKHEVSLRAVYGAVEKVINESKGN